jgi:hypothetical protein
MGKTMNTPGLCSWLKHRKEEAGRETIYACRGMA